MGRGIALSRLGMAYRSLPAANSQRQGPMRSQLMFAIARISPVRSRRSGVTDTGGGGGLAAYAVLVQQHPVGSLVPDLHEGQRQPSERRTQLHGVQLLH